MISTPQLMTRAIPSSLNLSSPTDCCRKDDQKYNRNGPEIIFDSTGIPLPLIVVSNLERLRPKYWFVNLLMKKVNDSADCFRLRMIIVLLLYLWHRIESHVTLSCGLNWLKTSGRWKRKYERSGVKTMKRTRAPEWILLEHLCWNAILRQT